MLLLVFVISIFFLLSSTLVSASWSSLFSYPWKDITAQGILAGKAVESTGNTWYIICGGENIYTDIGGLDKCKIGEYTIEWDTTGMFENSAPYLRRVVYYNGQNWEFR